MPFELFALLADTGRLDAYGAALARALAEKPQGRVVCHGPGALLWSLTAAAAGATVTVAEPGAHFAPLIREVVQDNGLSARISVTRGGLRDLPAACRQATDIVVLDDFDCALLGRGLLAQARWAREELLAPVGVLIPRAARLYAAPAELLLGPQCGFDLRPVDDYRGVAPNEPTALVAQSWRQLAQPCEVAQVDFVGGREKSHPRIDFCVERSGVLNALASWYVLELNGEARLDNAPAPEHPRRAQAVSFLEEPLEVAAGDGLSVDTALSQLTGLSFSALEDGRVRSYGRVRATLPAWHFPMLADPARNEAFVGAIERALVQRPGARVLDIGAGSGLLALAAARAGAGHVTACEMVPHIAQLARSCVARNGADAIVEIVPKASYLVGVPQDMPQRASLLVSETVDHGLLGERFLVALAHARDALLTADAQVIPCAATLYLAAIDLHTETVGGFDLRAIDQLRLGHYTGLQLAETAHVLLTEPQIAHSFDFQSGLATPQQTRFELPVVREGVCSGVALWFDLQLDAQSTLSTAPGAGTTAWDQGIVFFEQAVDVSAGDTLPIWCDHDLEQVSVYPDPEFLRHVPHRTWPRRRAIWALALRAEAAERPQATETLMRQLRAADPAQLERIWRTLTAEDSPREWLRRDLLADLYAQLGHEL